MAAPNLSELAQKRFEVVRSPDGRITNYYDKQTGRTLSQTEFNNFIQQQAGSPSGLQAFEPNSIGSIMGRANEMLPFAQQLGLGQPGVLPLEQQHPDVLTGTVAAGGPRPDLGMPKPTVTLSPFSAGGGPRLPTSTPTKAGTGIGVPQSAPTVTGTGMAPPVAQPSTVATFPSGTAPVTLSPFGPGGGPRLPTSTPTRVGTGVAVPQSSPTRAGTVFTPANAITQAEADAVRQEVIGNAMKNSIPNARYASDLMMPSSQPTIQGQGLPGPAGIWPPSIPKPTGRAPMPPMPAPPPAGAPNAAVRSWFGKLSGKQKAALGAVGAGVGYAVMNKAADTARKQSTAAIETGPTSFDEMLDPITGRPITSFKTSKTEGPTSFDEMLDPITGKPITSFKTPKVEQPTPKKAIPSRAANVLRAASAAQGQAAPQQETASAAASGADKVPVTTSGRPDYNYYAEMMNAADRNDAYARDLINLKEQARMAAIDAGARGEKFRFVPVKDYMNNRIIFVNAGGNDVVLDMNDPRQGVEYQKLLEKSGVDAATMTDWMHRSSRPMLRYMQPAGGNRDVTPDFGYMRRSVELGEGKPAASTTMATQAPTSAMKQSGNIDLNNRPVVKNADGSISTVRSMSIGTPEGEVLIPTISPDGRVLSENEAIDLFRKTGKHLGIFNTPGQATEYAKQLSSRQGQTYGNASTSEMPTPTAKAPSRPEPQPTSVASVAPTTSAEETDKQLPWTDDQRSALQALRSFRLKSSRFGG